MAEMTMIERVARTIARRRYGDDGYRDEDDGVQYWELCVDYARDVIEEMRKPTDAMLEADGSDPFVWEVMIDAALTPPPTIEE